MKNDEELLLPAGSSIRRETVSFTQSVYLFCTSIQFLSMVLLTAQQTAMPFLVRETNKDRHFLPTTSVFMMEVLKVLACCMVTIYNEGSFKKFYDKMHNVLWIERKETIMVSVPAVVYALQNNLYYIALANIDPTTYSVTYQLRILTTAILAVCLLQKKLSLAQWGALLISLTGVIMVQLDQSKGGSSVGGNITLGILATISMCWTSAFAGVYFEKMLKFSTTDVWIQNIRLSLLTLIFAGGTMIASDGEQIINNGGLLQGWTGLVWLVTILNSIGGIVVSIVMKYADNVKKTYCQTLAIGLTAVLALFLGERSLSFLLVSGVTLVISSILIYSFYPPPQPSNSNIIMNDEEELA